MSELDAALLELLEELPALGSDRGLERAAALGPLGDVLPRLVDATTRLASSEAGRAVEIAGAVIALVDARAPAPLRSAARRSKARALAYLGRFDEAIAECLDAVGIASAAGALLEVGRARLASMHALGELGRLDEAIEVGEQARRDFLAIDEPAFAARADINLGISHLRCDRPRAALTCFDRARPLLGDDRAVLGQLENSRGEALVLANRFGEADDAFAAALDIFEAHDAPLPAAIAEGNRADLAAREGRLDRALHHFERARRRLQQCRSPAHLARLVAEQADVKGTLGLPLEALDEYEDALSQLDRCGLALEAARARSGMGAVLLRLGRTAAAETALAAAATAFDDLGHATARARVDLLRAELALHHERLPEARRLALRSMIAVHDRPADLAASRLLLARIALAQGDEEATDAEIAAAHAAARRLDLAPLLADILSLRGALHHRRGNHDRAVADLSAAVEHIERLRGALQADRVRAAFLGRRASSHARLVAALLDRGGDEAIADAFAVIEQAKSRSLLDQIGRDLAPAAAALTADERALRTELQRARSDLNALYSRLADDVEGAAGSGWSEAVARRERDAQRLEARLLAARPALGGATPATLHETMAHLDAGTRLLEYFVCEDRLVAFAVGRDGASVHRLPVTLEDVAGAVERLRFQVDRALRAGERDGRRAARRLDDARNDLRHLHDALLAPLVEAGAGADRLCIVPHGGLHFVPFGALWDGHRHLIEAHEVHVCPSASLLVRRPPRRCAGPPVVAGVGDARAPGTIEEAQQLARRLRVPAERRLLGGEATVQRVIALAADAEIVHLACHGRFVPDAPQASGLRLADRWLTTHDLADATVNARLVTLSACETGRHLVEAGDELIGLLRSLLVAGAASVILSLWRVDDKTAGEFMDDLYGHGDIEAPIAMLRRAQRAMLARRPHPAYWAGFALVGAP